MSGVICERKTAARVKTKLYEMVVRPTGMYGLEMVTMRSRQEVELEEAKLKMLKFSLGGTIMNKIRNEDIRGI